MAANPIANAEILRKILKQLSNKELLKISFVNKLWNYEARSVMRRRGNLRVYLESADVEPCQKLKAFASDLDKMRIVPFAGINIIIDHDYDCQSISNGSLDPSYKIILDRLSWKHFSVKCCYEWDACRDCPALVLVKKILEEAFGLLEELTLINVQEEFLRAAFQGRSLPRLKILKVDHWDSCDVDGHLTSAFIKSLVSRAPKLKELHVQGEINFLVNVLEGSCAVLVPTSFFSPLLQPTCESLISSVRAERMKILIQNEDMDLGLLNRFIPMSLEASRTTLKTLIMDLLFAVPLMCYGICLENVTTLEIHLNVPTLDVIEPPLMGLLKGVDFTRVFPKLNQVAVLDGYEYDRNFSAGVVSAFVEQGNHVLREALHDRAINIKLLKFYAFSVSQESAIPLFAQIFPHVKTLDMNSTSKFPFAVLREHFVCLEEVTASYKQNYF